MRSIVALRWSLPTTLVLAAVVATESARAATFCVGTVPELEAAFASARTNNQADTIQVRQGTYFLTNTLAFGGDTNQDDGKSLTLIGGFASFVGSCVQVVEDGSTTILEGDPPLSKVIDIRPEHGAGAATYRVEGLTLKRASVVMQDLPASTGHEFILANNRIRSNPNTAAAFVLSGTGSLARIYNNLFHDNGSGNSGDVLAFTLQSSSVVARVIHNTFADNDRPAGAAVLAFSCPAGAPEVAVENNLFWNNQPLDLDLASACVSTVAFNNLPLVAGTPDFGCCNVNHNPAFESSTTGNYRLAYGSPVIDLGDLTPDGGLPAFDLDGNPRVNGALPDLGAYEIPWVFADGFESGDTAAWSLAVP